MANISKINSDGGSRGNPGPAASAYVVYDDNEVIIHEESKYLGSTTNNVAEYTSVLMALEWLSENKEMMAGDIEFFMDSELVVKQLTGVYRIKSPHLKPLAIKVKSLLTNLPHKVFFKAVRRGYNKEADRLVNVALDSVSS